MMSKDTELLDVLESMYDPEQAILDQELEDIHEAEESLLYGDDDDVESMIDDDIDTEDLDDDSEESFDTMESDDIDSVNESAEEPITEADLFDDYGVINY